MYWYFEPYNECMSRCTQTFFATHNSTSWDSGHGFFSDPYYSEYLPFWHEPYGIRGFHDDFSFQNFFPVGDLSPTEKEYLLSLEKWAKEQNKLPAYGFCRSLCRVGQMRTLLGGKHFVQYRNPHEMLRSSIDKGLLGVTLLILKGIAPGSLPHRLGMVIPARIDAYAHAIPSHGWDMNFVAPFPELLQLHFESWVISTIAGAFYADYTFNVNEMYYSQQYRLDVEKNLHELTGFDVHFDDIKLKDKEKSPVFDPRMLEYAIDKYIGNREKIKKFQIALEEISGLPVIQPVQTIERLAKQFLLEYPRSSDNAVRYKAIDIAHELLEDLSQHYIDGEKVQAALREDLRQCSSGNVAQNALRAELDAVYASKSWRVTRPLRAGRALVRKLFR